MIKVLKNNEIVSIFGGWTCQASFLGKPFYKAEWNDKPKRSDLNLGVCFYDLYNFYNH